MSDTRVLRGPRFRQPVQKTTLGKLFFSNAEKYGNRICQIDGNDGKTETFASVKTRSTRLAIAMRNRGITSDDVITTCSQNTLDNTIPIISALYLGAKVANLDRSLSVRHTKHLLSLVSPKMIFVEEADVEMIEQSLEGLDFSTEIIVFGDSDKYCVFSHLVQAQEDEVGFKPLDGDPDEIALMLFSSGTTGLPKAICHSHYSFLLMVQQVGETGNERSSLYFTSFYWATAMLMLTTCFKTGNYRVFCRNPSAEDIFRIIETHKVEYIFTAPILTYMLTSYENAKKYDTSSLKLIRCAGTPMTPMQIKKMNELFSNCFTTSVYALTEVGVVSCFDIRSPREVAARKMSLGSCGNVAVEVQLKVKDLSTGVKLGPHQKGEICVKSPGTMKGYYRADSSQVYDEEDFLATGDVGYYDEDGCVYLVGRVKEMFKYQSWHIVPAIIEAVLLEHPAVKEAVVFGLPREEEGEVPAACIVLQDACNVSAEELDEFLKERVADRERLRGGVNFVEVLPKTPTGKVVRSEVRDSVMKMKN